MNCYNHEDRPAVASCQVCRKNLCRECADKYSPILCDDCYSSLRKQEFESLKQARRKIIRTFIISVVLFVLMLFWARCSMVESLCGFILPFGWSYFSEVKLPPYIGVMQNGWITIIFFYIFKVLFSLVAGLPLLIYAIYKLVKLSKAVKTAEIEEI